METKQCDTQKNPMGSWNKKVTGDKKNLKKYMECSKSSSMREVHRDTSLYQETWKPNVSRIKEIKDQSRNNRNLVLKNPLKKINKTKS